MKRELCSSLFFICHFYGPELPSCFCLSRGKIGQQICSERHAYLLKKKPQQCPNRLAAAPIQQNDSLSWSLAHNSDSSAPPRYFKKKVVLLAKLLLWVSGCAALYVCCVPELQEPESCPEAAFGFASLQKTGRCWRASPDSESSPLQCQCFASSALENVRSTLVELEEMFLAVFCLDALSGEVSPPACEMGFSCHGAVPP